MLKNSFGFCKELKTDYVISINYIDSSTHEGNEYSKNKMECPYNNEHHTCKMNDCPIWENAPNIIDENGFPVNI